MIQRCYPKPYTLKPQTPSPYIRTSFGALVSLLSSTYIYLSLPMVSILIITCLTYSSILFFSRFPVQRQLNHIEKAIS